MSSRRPTPSAPTVAALVLDGVPVAYGAHRVLTNVSLTVSGGDRVGVIGGNGAGKSTLLRVAAGLLPADAGTVWATAPGMAAPEVGLLHQEAPFAAATTVQAALDAAVAPLRAIGAEVDRAAAAALARQPGVPGVAARYQEALDAAEQRGAWQVDTRVARTLAGLGLDSLDPAEEAGRLSGGMRARLALAWLLLRAPDVLLLDEPTNHLDDAATAYLVRLLVGWRGPVLLASHDRAFLDEAVTALVDLDPVPLGEREAGTLVADGTGTGIGVTRFTGTWTDYRAARAAARRRWEHRYRDEQEQLRRLRAEVRDSQQVGHEDWQPRTEVRGAAKFFADRNAKVVSRRVGDARARHAALEASQVRRPPVELRFGGLQAQETGAEPPSGALLSLDRVGVEGRLAPTSLQVTAGSRLLVTGPNGSGKSTLLAVLAERLAPSTGFAERHTIYRTGLLAQEVQLPDPAGRGPDRTVLQAYHDLVGAALAEATPLPGLGLFEERDGARPVRVLSTGQRRRLALAVVLADPPDLLLLDEPTNHLSLPLVEALEAAIPSYRGAVVVASHDRRLREQWSGQRLELEAPRGR